MIVVKGLIKEQLLFKLRKGHTFIVNGIYVWILMIVLDIHKTDTKCCKTKRMPHICDTVFGHIEETRI